MLTAFLLPLALTLVLQGSSCQENNSTKSKANSNRPPANQVDQSINKQRTFVDEGVWGGPGIRMQVTKQGAEIVYDCARGTISEQIRLDGEGRFQAKGTHLRNRPGPVRLGESSKAQPASYAGNVKDQTMTLEVTLTAKSENIGNFTLTHGREGRLRKCL